MKKKILSLALVAGIVGMMAAGCSSEKSASSTDSTKVDSAAMSAPKADSAMTTDTTKKDTTKTPPKM